MFRILPVRLFGNNKIIDTYALLDEGSAITMLDADMANDLNIYGPKNTLELQWFGNKCASEESQTVSLGICGMGHDLQKFDLVNVKTVRHLELPVQSINMSDLTHNLQQLRGLPIHDYQQAVPKILIGLDNIHLSIATHQISSSSPGPVATKTRLGWVVYGPSRVASHTSARVLHISTSVLDNLQKSVEEFFELESFGVGHKDKQLESADDKRARQVLERTTIRIGEQYQTGLLWKSDHSSLPESKSMATTRLLSIERKMKQNPVFAERYNDIIDGYVQKGYARKLCQQEVDQADNKTWYLPHFAITNPNKPEKMRIVFDAAAFSNGVSLNSMLLKGPDLNRPLLAVLYQFRMGSIGVCADVKEMFLRVRIQQSDVNSQRFLWRRGDTSRPIDVYVMQSMIFGAACSPCAAQYVKNKNADEYAEYLPAAVNAIKNHHYVDDFVSSFNSELEAIQVTKAVVDIHRKGGFQLRGFVSNNNAVLEAVGAEDETNQTTIKMELDTIADKILGMYWDHGTDEFLFRLTFSRLDPAVLNGSRCPTKRELLSATMSIFDPFGLLANFTIYAKLLLQSLWQKGTGWDDDIPEDIHHKWLQWLSKLDTCRQVRVPRCYQPNINSFKVQLHIFADASQSALAVVAYLRIEVGISRYSVVFVAGKSRCAPKKLTSIPRLELQAAVMAVRIKTSILDLHKFDIDRIIYWTDSKTVVQWVRSDKLQFRPFVAYRVEEIRDKSCVEDWRWLPTNHNAADDATRAKYPVRFSPDNRWLRGPEFLSHAESQWPVEPAEMLCENGAEEVRPHSVHLVCTNVINVTVQTTVFNDFHKACRSMAFVLRFCNYIRTKAITRGELFPIEIDEGERHLIRAAQAEHYFNELAMLRHGKPIKKESQIYCLLPHIDKHGLLRMTGRIDKALHLPEDARNPVLLPKDHHLTAILVSTYHRRMRHQQDAAVVCEIRLKYWIPHLKTLVRRARAKCMLCRIKSARPVEPVMGQLPNDRLTPFVRPFTYTGLDYFGPIYVSIGRRREKRWVALFTCMTTRGIHLELAADLSTDSCILCIRNFVNIRGVPIRIRSDNGTNFVGASRELRDHIAIFDHAEIQRELGVKHIEWIFNCPSNPEAGGCWERLVRSVKRVLDITLKELAPKVETLRSLLLEAANIINSRPLTHLPVHGDEDEPLTPNHFILGAASSTQTPGRDDENLICMRKQWRVAQSLKNRFWKRWIMEYLPDLTRRSKGFEEYPPLSVGSLVLICDSLLPRGEWRRGRILEVYTGPDGRVRTALVKTQNGELKRPVNKLAVLDIVE